MKSRAYVNFALIKYWGKKIEELKIPYQSSLSFTINNLYTETSVNFNSELKEDVIKVNGKTSGVEISRVKDYLNVLRKMYGIKDYCYLESNNFVPTASGLASSASAFASIAKAFLNHLNLSDEELSKAARLGSGSASRSIYDGFAIWHHGFDHNSSYAEKLNVEWPEFRIIVCLVEKGEKKISSTVAMNESTKTIEYEDFVLKSKIDLDNMLIALDEKDIDNVGLIAENNSERMHNLIEKNGYSYKNKDSYKLIDITKKLREEGIKAYFTMDAGPNVKIITTNEYVNDILAKIPYETIVCSKGEGAKIV